MVIYSFEFEECVLAAYNTDPVECNMHGPLELRELAPDAVSIKVLEVCSLYSGAPIKRPLKSGQFVKVPKVL